MGEELETLALYAWVDSMFVLRANQIRDLDSVILRNNFGTTHLNSKATDNDWIDRNKPFDVQIQLTANYKREDKREGGLMRRIEGNQPNLDKTRSYASNIVRGKIVGV